MSLPRQLRDESDFEQLPEDFPAFAHIADVEERRGFSLYYTFVIEVKTRGGSKYFIHRRYSQFLTLHTKLEENYGPENGMAPYICILPELPSKIYVGNKKDIAESRIPLLNGYMKSLHCPVFGLVLLNSPVWLLLDEDLRMFYYQTSSDSERIPHALRRLRPQTRKLKKESQPISDGDRPRAEALFDFKGTASMELNLKCGDLIYLLSWVNREWLEGTAGNRTGIFPASFVRIIKKLPEEQYQVSLLRCYFHDHDTCLIRDISLEEDVGKCPSYKELLDLIRNQFPDAEVALNMRDTDGEMIRLMDNSEMELLITRGKRTPRAKNYFPWELHVTHKDDFEVYKTGP